MHFNFFVFSIPKVLFSQTGGGRDLASLAGQ